MDSWEYSFSRSFYIIKNKTIFHAEDFFSQGRLQYCNDAAAGGFTNCVGNVYGGLPKVPCPSFAFTKCAVRPATISTNSSIIVQSNSTNQSQYRKDHLESHDMQDHQNQSFGDAAQQGEFESQMCPQDLGFFLGQSILIPRVWSVPTENFENFGSACITLLRLFATDNMFSIYQSIMDIPSTTDNICSDGSSADNGCPPGTTVYTVSLGPQENNMPQNILYGMTFIFIANAFISQLVIGVLIDNIRRQSGSALYTEAQRVWIATAKTLSRLTLRHNTQIPGWQPRKMVYEAVVSKNYETAIMGVVILNTAWMCTEHDPRAPAYVPFVQPTEMTFLAVYIFDLLMKLFAFGIIESHPRVATQGFNFRFCNLPAWNWRITYPFFSDPWNCFDFFIVLMSLIDLSLPNVDLSFFKLLRVLRVFKLVNKVKTLKIMIATLLGAVRSILAALLFLGIWLFIFAAIGNDKMVSLMMSDTVIFNCSFYLSNKLNFSSF